MIHRYRRLLCPLFVLSLGLYSCRPAERDISPPYRIDEPQWKIKAGTETGFSADAATGTTHDIGDVLHFPESPPGLRVHARCQSGDKVYVADQRFSTAQDLALFTMLPRETLAPGVLAMLLRCSLEFHAFNAEGSVHNFRMPEVTVLDEGLSQGIDPTRPQPTYLEDAFEHATFGAGPIHDVRLICDGFEFAASVGVNGRFSLNDFDTTQAPSMRERGLRTCRLLGLREAQVQSISSPFKIGLHASAPATGCMPVQQSVHELFRHENPFQFFTFHMQNPEAFTLRFRISKPAPTDFVAVAFAGKTESALALTEANCVPGEQMNIAPVMTIQGTSDVKLSESEGYWSVEMPPQSQLTGDLSARVTPNQRSLGKFWMSSLVFQEVRPLKMEMFQLEDGKWVLSDARGWGCDALMWYAAVPVHLPDRTPLICGQ